MAARIRMLVALAAVLAFALGNTQEASAQGDLSGTWRGSGFGYVVFEARGGGRFVARYTRLAELTVGTLEGGFDGRTFVGRYTTNDEHRVIDEGTVSLTLRDNNTLVGPWVSKDGRRGTWTLTRKGPTGSAPSGTDMPHGAAPSGGSPQGFGPTEDNTTFSGATTLRYFATNDFAQCQNACAASPQCRAYTFVKRGAYASNPTTAVCYLSSAIGQRVHDPCCISAVRGQAAGAKGGTGQTGPGGIPPSQTPTDCWVPFGSAKVPTNLGRAFGRWQMLRPDGTPTGEILTLTATQLPGHGGLRVYTSNLGRSGDWDMYSYGGNCSNPPGSEECGWIRVAMTADFAHSPDLVVSRDGGTLTEYATGRLVARKLCP